MFGMETGKVVEDEMPATLGALFEGYRDHCKKWYIEQGHTWDSSTEEWLKTSFYTGAINAVMMMHGIAGHENPVVREMLMDAFEQEVEQAIIDYASGGDSGKAGTH
jgi:hypothetical protein